MLAFVAGAFAFTSCESNEAKTNTKDSVAAEIKTEDISFMVDSLNSKSFVAYDAAKKDKMPIVIIVPEWWGIGDYVKGRAKQLAALGYFAFAVDFYGDAKQGEDPKTAGELSGPFYKDANKGNAIIAAALAKAKTYSQADGSKTAVIGYCFGGSMALNYARIGNDVTGVVSFHGGLNTGVLPVKGMKADVLVCHGLADTFVPEADAVAFKKQMDSVGAIYTFKEYANATHAFTNPNADEKAKKFNMPISYNAEADKASFADMKAFFEKIFK